MTLLKFGISLMLLVFSAGTFANSLGLSDAQLNSLLSSTVVPVQQKVQKSAPEVKKTRKSAPEVKKKAATELSTNKIKEALIKRSHAYYSGNCPCPYNTTSRGRRCGKRSAYSRPGGASPLCYKSDVTDRMVSEYRSRQ